MSNHFCKNAGRSPSRGETYVPFVEKGVLDHNHCQKRKECVCVSFVLIPFELNPLLITSSGPLKTPS